MEIILRATHHFARRFRMDSDMSLMRLVTAERYTNDRLVGRDRSTIFQTPVVFLGGACGHSDIHGLLPDRIFSMLILSPNPLPKVPSGVTRKTALEGGPNVLSYASQASGWGSGTRGARKLRKN